MKVNGPRLMQRDRESMGRWGRLPCLRGFGDEAPAQHSSLRPPHVCGPEQVPWQTWLSLEDRDPCWFIARIMELRRRPRRWGPAFCLCFNCPWSHHTANIPAALGQPEALIPGPKLSNGSHGLMDGWVQESQHQPVLSVTGLLGTDKSSSRSAVPLGQTQVLSLRIFPTGDIGNKTIRGVIARVRGWVLWGWLKGEKKKSCRCHSVWAERPLWSHCLQKGGEEELGKGGGTRGELPALGLVQRTMEAGEHKELPPFRLNSS